MKRSLLLILVFICCFSFSSSLCAAGNVRRNVATVMLAGLGGAILGLSTLSFYGNPQEHTGNIWAGLTIGVVGGLAYVGSRPGQNSSYYESGLNFQDFNPAKQRPSSAQLMAYSWEF